MSIDLDYANKLSIRLEQYKVKQTNPFRANFRCPLCGDSQKSKTKCRGWLLGRQNGSVHYYCHNCHFNRPLGVFLENYDKVLFDSYQQDRLLKYKQKKRDEENLKENPNKQERKDYSEKLKSLKKISQLKPDHIAKKYIESRRIPPHNHYKLYYTHDFNGWVNSIIPDKLPKNIKEGRIVFPFYDKDGNMFGFCGRSLKKSGLRYITIMLDETQSKFFGLNELDSGKRYYLFEGSIDSLFINNSIAAAGADSNVDDLPNNENCILVYDNEPHNKEIVKKMERSVKKGYNICIWPDNLETGNDFNDLVMKGYRPNKLKKIIDGNIYSGIYAELRLSEWRKV